MRQETTSEQVLILYPTQMREFSEMENLHLLLLALLFEVSGVLSSSHFLLLDVMMIFLFGSNTQ